MRTRMHALPAHVKPDTGAAAAQLHFKAASAHLSGQNAIGARLGGPENAPPAQALAQVSQGNLGASTYTCLALLQA